MQKRMASVSHQRVSVDLYRRVRAWLFVHDPDCRQLIDWSEKLGSPPDAEALAREIVWIILCAGRRAQAARTIAKKVWSAIEQDRPVVEVFGYRKKAEAIEAHWTDRARLFEELNRIGTEQDFAEVVAWCAGLTFIGDDTKWHLAKNIGIDVCKPDIWLCRLAGFADPPRRPEPERFRVCMDLCRPLATATGDRIATVDSVLWLACNKGVLVPGTDAVVFEPGSMHGGSIY